MDKRYMPKLKYQGVYVEGFKADGYYGIRSNFLIYSINLRTYKRMDAIFRELVKRVVDTDTDQTESLVKMKVGDKCEFCGAYDAIGKTHRINKGNDILDIIIGIFVCGLCLAKYDFYGKIVVNGNTDLIRR